MTYLLGFKYKRVMYSRSILYWSLGFFSTCPVIAFPLLGSYLSVFSILLVLVFFDLLRSRSYKISDRIIINQFSKWIAISLISCLWGFLYFGLIGKSQFQQASMSYVPKLVIYYFLFRLFITRQNENKTTKFALGIFYGAVLNMLIAFLDAAIFYATSYSFINDFFGTYIEKQKIYMGVATEGYYRASGLNVDQAAIGLLAAYIAAYSFYIKKTYLIFLSILGNIAAVSFVGIGSVIGVIILHSANVKSFFKVMIAGFTIVVALVIVDNPYVNLMVDAVTARLDMKKDSSGDSDNARAMYWKLFIPAAANNPQTLFIGTGYFTASYAYHTIGIKGVNTGKPYDPEQTYFSTYFDIGLIGFIIYMLMYWKTYKKLKYYLSNENKSSIGLFLAFIEAAAFSYLGYHFTIGASETLMTICAITMIVVYMNKAYYSSQIDSKA